MSSQRPTPGTVLQGALCGCARQALLDLQQRLETRPGPAIHGLRVRMKKLRALLELLRDLLPAERLHAFKKRVRSLRQAFTQDRDAEVLAATEAALLGHPPAASCSAATLLTPALRQRARRHVDTTKGLCEDLALLDLSALTWAQVEAAHAWQLAQGRRQWRECEDDPSPENLHDLRKTAKILYYQSLLLQRRHRKHARRHLVEARKLGSTLGRLHDVDELLASPRGTGHGPLPHLAREHRQELEHRARRLARRLFEEG